MVLSRTICVILFIWLIFRGFCTTEKDSSALLYTAKDLLRAPYFPQTSRRRKRTTSPSLHLVVRNSITLLQRSSLALMLVLLANDVEMYPGPDRTPVNIPIKCSTINPRSLKSIHKDVTTSSTICNLQRFQDLVYSENLDVVCVNETWLNKNICDVEILHSEYTIFRKDRINRSGGGVLIGVKTASFKSVKEYLPKSEELQHLEIVSADLVTASNHHLLFCSCYRPPDADPSWMEKFNSFLDQTCDQYRNVVISGDFNLPNISWDTIGSTVGANELSFVEILNDHFLSQLNTTPTRGSNVLDLVITSVPELVSVSEILPPEKTEIFTDHCAIMHEFSAYVKAPIKAQRYVYNYDKGDFVGLRAALGDINLSSLAGDNNDDINTDWQRWKNAFMSAVATYIPVKRLRGRNPAPWINGPILNMIKKKESVRQKLKISPSNYLQHKFKTLRAVVKGLLRESREKFFSSLASDLKNNPKRFWSVLKQTSKSKSVPDLISTATSGASDSVTSPLTPRVSADNPRG